jgi:ABC-type multidrug transport system fused ATPase/permease subunit
MVSLLPSSSLPPSSDDVSFFTVFLLDDPLSAVDAHVGKDLFFDCIYNTLKTQRKKGVILVTHQLQNMRFADQILILSPSGDQVFYGSHEELISRRAEFPYIDIDPGEMDEGSGDEVVKMRCESDGSVASSVVVEETNPLSEDPLPVHETTSTRSDLLVASRAKSFIISVEDRAVGSVTNDTYYRYLQAGGVCLGSTALVYAIFGQLLSMMADYWLRLWASEAYGPQDQPLYQWVFALLVLATILVGYHKVELWFYFTNIASKEMHLQSLWGVLHSPLRFFVANPTGRILNRFTKDQNQVDELFPSTFFDCFQCVLFCLSSLVLVCASVPWLLIVMAGVGALFVYYRNRYIKSSLEVKRIEAVTRSPVYADFSATLDGLSTLRAYQLQGRFVASFRQSLTDNARAWYSFLMTSRWLGFRLDMISSLILIVLLFFSCGLKGQVDVGLIGFALVYTLSLAGLLQWTVRQSAEVENQMTSVERIRTYGSLPPEDGYEATVEDLKQSQTQLENDKHSPSHEQGSYLNLPADLENQHKALPQHTNTQNPLLVTEGAIRGRGGGGSTAHHVGHVVIKSLTVTYRHDLSPVLKDLSIDIPSGYKVGICGRTGSGKSSLLQALLRLNIISSGDILIDNVSLLSMSLEESRGLISLIPQDPHLFSGTVRFNIDPFLQYDDKEIWNAVRDAQLYDHLKAYEEQQRRQQQPVGDDTVSPHGLVSGLDLLVEEGGKNFSVGQRQLLSLARAIVRNAKVILMDEVTASIDYLTDKAIQDTIRTSHALSSATIITVAHRLRTIADSDLIGFIEDGRFVEVGRPYELLRQKSSQFRRLAEESNEVDEIKAIAKNKLLESSTTEGGRETEEEI